MTCARISFIVSEVLASFRPKIRSNFNTYKQMLLNKELLESRKPKRNACFFLTIDRLIIILQYVGNS